MKYLSTSSLLASASLLLSEVVTASPLVTRATQSAPHFVAYWDNWLAGENGPPPPATVWGFNTLLMAFLMSSGPQDQAGQWIQIGADTRATTKAQYTEAGVLLMVSAFGSTEQPTTAGNDPTDTANYMAGWVKDNLLDGIDIDYEDFTAINAANGNAENWLITFTTALRKNLPAGQYIITHAPVAPWFSPMYKAGAYTKVHKQVGSLIDWYNVQFYNQGTSEYTDCNGLLTTSTSTWPDSAVFQIHSTAGVPLDKIVIGKPGTTGDANNGYMTTSTLNQCIAQAKKSGWNAGVMVWEFPDVTTAWIDAVRGSVYPVGTMPSPPPPPPGSGPCVGVPAWNPSAIFQGGQKCSDAGYLWTAKWWTQNNNPATDTSGVWVKGGKC